MSDYKSEGLMLPALPKAKELSLAGQGLRRGLVPRRPRKARHRRLEIPSKSNRKVAIPYDALLYRRSATGSKICSDSSKIGGAPTPRYDRCAHTYFVSAICIRRSRRLLARDQ